MKALRAAVDKLSLQELGTTLRSLYAASAHRDILARIDTSLVLVDACLINIANGEYRQVADSEETIQPAQLAIAAAQLLQGREPRPSILLLLPISDFAATRFNLGLAGEKLLRSALKLQAHSLLPAYDEELLLGVHGANSEGVALWYPAKRAAALFDAFAEQGLFLAALLPRTLALLQTHTGSEQVFLDEDARHCTLLECRNGAIRSLLCVRQEDLQQPDFAAQWHSEQGKLGPVRARAGGQQTWSALRQLLRPYEQYCFFPAGSEQAGRALIAQQQRRVAKFAAAAVVVLLFLPFVANWIQLQYLEGIVGDLREESTDARRSQAAVFQMEDEWGAIAEYPRQDVGHILLTLNELIDSSLSSFEIDKGVVDITGFSRDPALLLEQLAEREDFYNVGQSRGSSGGNSTGGGERFGIRFNVSGIDFPGYEQKYLVVEP